MGTIRDFKYKKIENFLSKDVLNLASTYCEIKHRQTDVIENPNRAELEGNYDTAFYADYFCESLLMRSVNKMNDLTGLKLSPTYSYWRMYTFDSQLKEHTDRPACEISVSINISNSGEEWPIYIDGNPIILKPGDAVIYLGCELKHKREKFTGDHNAQIFMHYVDKSGPFSNHILDRRSLPGEALVGF
jgi:hypothetical protein|tara:strand:- start:227 stop:790 length:564 start_codon:yes stop_codon:yes gene_type:complete